MVDRQVRRAPEIVPRPNQPQQLRSGKAYSQWSEQDGGNIAASVDLSTLLRNRSHPTPSDLEEVLILEEGFTVVSGEEPPLPSRSASPLGLLSNSQPIAVMSAGSYEEAEAAGKRPLVTPLVTRQHMLIASAEAAEATSKADAMRAKRKRERERKKAQRNESYGEGAARRTAFVRDSLEVAHNDFRLSEAAHCANGYTGLPERGLEFTNRNSAGLTRLEYLQDVGGYRLADTTADA
ncbi:hypothetical protein FRC00_006845, partial [Tulasnella sp. 408]